jgi:YD repeat-containing protein
MATYGGWTETNTYANSKQSIEKSDRFGRVVWRQDLGDHVFASSYDAAGRLYQRVGPETLSWSYYNTGLAYSVGDGAGSSALYGYDAAGNKIQEYTVKAGIVVQNAFATYDELGRMKSWGEYGGAVSPGSSTAYDYDLVGNIRHSHSVQAMLDVQGANIYAPQVDYWYRFDAMNRVTADKGALSNGAIVGGTAYTYDMAGRRKTSTTSVTRSQQLWKYTQPNGVVRWHTQPPDTYVQEGGTTTIVPYSYTSAQVETYNYDGAGNLQSVAIATQAIQTTSGIGVLVPVVGALGAAVTRAVYTNDAMGRTIAQSDYLEDGTSVAYSRAVTYNAKSQVTNETSNTRQGTDTWTSVVTNAYGSGAGYALGAATVVTTSDSKNSYWQYSTTTTNAFAWYDGAVQSSVSFARTGATTSNSTYSYGASGQLASISVVDGVRNRTITFTTDMLGQVIRRDEADNVTSGTTSGDPHEVWYRFNGRQIAFAGNNGTLDTDYAASIAARTKAPVGTYAFRNGDWSGPAIGDYDPSLEHINSYSQGSAGGGYVVRAGDTLQGIALGLWGDASLWYKLAEANGLSGAAGLIARSRRRRGRPDRQPGGRHARMPRTCQEKGSAAPRRRDGPFA